MLFMLMPGLHAGERPVFSASEKKLLRKGGIMTFAYMKGEAPALSGISETEAFTSTGVFPAGWEEADVLIVEKAYLKVKPSREADLAIYNALTVRSGLRGMSYYSITDESVKQLILESGRVSSCGDGSPVADVTAGEVAGRNECFFTVKDNRLGTICFSGTVVYQKGSFFETDISCGSVSRMGMSVFSDGGYLIRHYIIKDEAGGGYLYCSVQAMKLEGGIMKKLNILKPESLGNRIRGETVHFFRRAGYDISPEIIAFR